MAKRTSTQPRIDGYPKTIGGRLALTDFHGKVLGYGHLVSCSKVRPGQPGAWISGERCSYRFKIGDDWYSMRGRGEGIAAAGRRMAKPPRGY